MLLNGAKSDTAFYGVLREEYEEKAKKDEVGA